MQVRQHMPRWYFPPAKTAESSLSQALRYIQPCANKACASHGIYRDGVLNSFLPENFLLSALLSCQQFRSSRRLHSHNNSLKGILK